MPHPGAEKQRCKWYLPYIIHKNWIPRVSFIVYLLLLEGITWCICSDAEENSMRIWLSILLSLIQEQEVTLNGTKPSSSLSLTIPRSLASRSWTATSPTMISLVKQGKYPRYPDHAVSSLLLYRIAIQFSESMFFLKKVQFRDHASELAFVYLYFWTFSIPLEAVFQEGSLPPTVHPVVKEEKYCGEIKLALTFTPAVVCSLQYPCGCNSQAMLSAWTICLVYHNPMLIWRAFLSRKLAAPTTRRVLTAAGIDLPDVCTEQ